MQTIGIGRGESGNGLLVNEGVGATDESKAKRAMPMRSIEGGAIWKRLLFSEYLVLYLSIVYFLAVWPFRPDLASPTNIRNIFSNMLPLLAVAIGETFVLITAGIDLSVTSIIALASMFGALVMTADNGLLGGSSLAVPVGIVTMLLTGAAVGTLNGTAISRFHMPPFIVTLTSMMFLSGFSIWLTKSEKVSNLPRGFVVLGEGSIAFIPYALIITVALGVVGHVILRGTVLGRWLYAVGHNVRAAAISGVPVRMTVTLAYVISGVCAAVASILYTARLETGDPVLGQRILLDIIGATVIGGTSLFGGKGKVLWTVFGVLFITVIDNSLNMLGLSHFTIMIVKGSVILFAALIDAVRNRLLASQ
jgi:ribose/xylose/arabinose/galactoside ABC-type transport system permease subunit